MNKLTERQNKLIEEIANEFTKINEQKKPMSKGNLFDVAGLLGQKEADLEQKHQIALDNLFYDEMLISIIEKDMEILNVELKELGLCVFKPKNWGDWVRGYVIDQTYFRDNSGYASDCAIKLDYRLDTKYVSFESKIGGIDQKNKEYKISSYVTPNTERFYTNIEEFSKDTLIIEKIKRLINQ